jgi:hypothetical protein
MAWENANIDVKLGIKIAQVSDPDTYYTSSGGGHSSDDFSNIGDISYIYTNKPFILFDINGFSCKLTYKINGLGNQEAQFNFYYLTKKFGSQSIEKNTWNAIAFGINEADQQASILLISGSALPTEHGVTSFKTYFTDNTKAYKAIKSITASSLTSLSSGGGATHIAKRTGLLATLSDHIDDILIVAGGGGGGGLENTTPGNGGGFEGGDPKLNDTVISDRSGTQSTGNAFGKGQGSETSPGGGGGFYGGFAGHSNFAGAGAGSGYIGNPSLFNKKMYGNNVPTTSASETHTASVTSKSSSPISYRPKLGDGYVKIKYLKKSEPHPTPSLADSYLFYPDLTTDGHDKVRNSDDVKSYYYCYKNGTKYTSSDTYYVGSLHGTEILNAGVPEWSVSNNMILKNTYSDGIYIWGFDIAPFKEQKIINPNCNYVEISMTLGGSNFDATQLRIYGDASSDNALLLHFTGTNYSSMFGTWKWFTLIDNDNTVPYNIMDEIKVTFKIPIENGGATGASIYVNNSLHSICTASRAIEFFNLNTDNPTDPAYAYSIQLTTGADYIKDFYIKFE